MKNVKQICNYSNYKCYDSYLLRTPLFSINELDKLLLSSFDSESLFEFFTSNKIFKEALLISSPDTYNVLSKSGQPRRQLIQTLIKYYVRMCVRSTPYGLNAGISNGKITDKTEIIIDALQQYKKHIRVDFEWICSVIRLIELDKELRKGLEVKISPICYIHGNRLINPYLSIYSLENDTHSKSSSIRYTKAVKTVTEYCSNFINIEDLQNYLREIYRDIEVNKIEELIDNLIVNEFLYTNLRFPISNIEDPLLYIITYLRKYDKNSVLYQQLLNTSRLISEYGKCEIGEGIDSYIEVCDQMKSIANAKSYLQIDMFKPVLCNKISRLLIKDLEECINLLIELAPANNKGYLEQYANSFLDKYGYYEEVSIVELLNENTGLGLPLDYISNDKNPVDAVPAKSTIYLKRLLNNYARNCKKEIKLTKKDLQNICIENQSENQKYKSSFDVFVEFIKKSENQYNIAISDSGATLNAGQALGRFLSYMDNSISNEIYKSINEIYKDIIIAEINEYPYENRLGNVCLNRNDLKYSITISSYNSDKIEIPITDLYIGLDRETKKFYIKSKSLNKRIITVRTNVLNELYCSNLSRFLYDVSLSEQKSLNLVLANFKLDNSIYTPRISYKNIILNSATWQIEERDIRLFSEKNDWNENDFEKFCKSINVPSTYYLKEYDKKILIHLENKTLVDIVIKKVKKEKHITLVEVLDNFDNLLLKDSDENFYLNEVILTFFPNESNYSDDNYTDTNCIDKKINANCNVIQNDKIHKFLMGDSGWIYIKLYGFIGREEELIGHYIKDFCDDLYEKGLLKKHFFIRYRDPKLHLRLRMQFHNNIFNSSLFNNLNSWLHILESNGLISKVTYDTYEREIIRYGGLELIEDAENVFYKDSIIIQKILRNTNRKEMSDMNIGILNILSIMESLELSLSEQLELLETNVNSKDYFDIFRKNRLEIIRLCSMEKSMFKEQEIDLLNILNERKLELQNYKTKIMEYNRIGKLQNKINDIFLSIIHMSCNRFKANNDWEYKILSLSRHGIYAYLEKSKHLI